MVHIGAALLILVLVMGIGAAVFVLWGVYNVSALQQHTRPVYQAIGLALERSIQRRAEDIEVPALDAPAMIDRGFRRYRAKCVQCHGAPGVARDDIGKSLTPVPANMVETARRMTPAEIFWTVKHGIKMSGMPAWEFAFSDDEIWSIVAFVMQLPRLSPSDYQAMDQRLPTSADQGQGRVEVARVLPPPDPERGRRALQGYACTSCHSIPGVIGPEPDIGPPLHGIASRRFIAGVLSNDFDHMVRWIRDPKAVDPLTAMPDLDVTPRDARDIAAYLYSMEQ